MAVVQKYRPFVLFDVEDAPKKKASITLLNALMVIGIGALCVGGVYSFAPSNNRQVTTSEPEPPCPSDYFYLKSTNSCYKLVHTLMTFKKAEIKCQEEGGHLASIHSKEESLVISGLYHSKMDADSEIKACAIIGLSVENGVPKWTDRSPIKYVDLRAGAVIDKKGKFGVFCLYDSSWNLFSNKDAKYKSICKMPANVKSKKDASGVVKKRKCWEDYTYFSETGKCYKSYPQETFDNAKTKCASIYRTALTSVTSEAENLFLVGLSNKYRDRSLDNDRGKRHNGVWLGLSFNEDGLEWDDGSPVVYKNWEKDEPVKDGIFYIYASGSQWRAEKESLSGDARLKKAFICKSL